MGTFRHPISHDQVLVRRLLKAVFKVVRCFSCKGRQMLQLQGTPRCFSCKGRQMLQLQGTPRCFSCKGRQDASTARDDKMLQLQCTPQGALLLCPSSGALGPGPRFLTFRETCPSPLLPLTFSFPPTPPPPSGPRLHASLGDPDRI